MTSAERVASRVASEYGEQESSLGTYAALVAVFNAGFAAAMALIWRSRGGFPDKTSFKDVVLLSLATQRLSRVITRDSVTAALRAPFARSGGPAGPGEQLDQPRGRGAQHVLGEMLTCPFCLGQWIAAAFVLSGVAFPRATRMVATMFTVSGLADYLQFGYAMANKAAEK